jgi:hypothetical protein
MEWKGGIESRGELVESIENDIQNKMQFVNPDVAPFKALSRIKSLLEKSDESELLQIWNNMRTENQWQEEDGVAMVITKRIAKLAGRK